MPFDHSRDDAARLLVIRGSGPGSMEEIADSVERAVRSVRDGQIPLNFGVLILVDEMGLVPELEDVLKIGAMLVRLQGCMGGRIALVASTTGKVIPTNVAAMHASDLGREVRAFLSEYRARAWLAEAGPGGHTGRH